MRCYEIMKKQLEVVSADLGASEAARRMREQSLSFFPVCDAAGRVEGVVTDRDIALGICGDRLSLDTPVAHVMSRRIVACAPGDAVSVAEELMVRHGVRHVLVLDDDGRLAGVLSLSDIAQYESPIRLARMVRKVAAANVRVESSRPPSLRAGLR